jgi:hypothetical protein
MPPLRQAWLAPLPLLLEGEPQQERERRIQRYQGSRIGGISERSALQAVQEDRLVEKLTVPPAY